VARFARQRHPNVGERAAHVLLQVEQRRPARAGFGEIGFELDQGVEQLER
jgi:hypothetical protein